jgi:two-component system sensor histidine kinase RegB
MPATLMTIQSTDTSVALRRLVILRWCLLVGEVPAILLVPPLLDVPLPVLPMLVVVSLQILANLLLARRLNQRNAFGAGELFVQLVLDIVALTVLMFLSGGAANPLISLLLPPVAAALALPARLVAIIAV